MFSLSMLPALAVLLFVCVVLAKCIVIVPNNYVCLVQRLGKQHRQLDAGPHFLIPFIDRVYDRHALYERTINITPQDCITKDNSTVQIDGVVFLRVVNPMDATYGVQCYQTAVAELAQTTMRAAIGSMELDQCLSNRNDINKQVIQAVNNAGADWGVRINRYEVSQLSPSPEIRAAMDKQVAAERNARAEILESEGAKKAAINHAEGQKKSVVLQAEADKESRVLDATAEAEELKLVADAKAYEIKTVSDAIANQGEQAVAMDLAIKAIEAKREIAKEGTIVLTTEDATSVENTVVKAMAAFGSVKDTLKA